MLTFINWRNLGGRVARASALCLLALAAALLQSPEARAQWTTSGTNTTTTNNVGIGTTAPTAQLELRVPSGDVISRFSNAGGSTGVLDLRYKFELQKHRMGFTDGTGQWMFYTQFSPSNTDSFGFFPGRLGIGTDNPGYPLTVRANTNIAPLNLIGGTGSVEIWKDANPLPSKAVAFGSAVPGNPAGDNLHLSTYNGAIWASRLTVMNATGNVGVGTSTPAVKLAVSGAGTNVYSTDAWIENNMHVQGNEVISQGGGRGRMRLGTAWGYVGLYAEASSAGAANDLVLGAGSGTVRVGPGGGVAQNFIIPSGRLGVGTTAPTVALDVNGDIRVSGNINAKYQDVAEWVPSVEKLSAGTVVILDVARDNHVAASSTSYDTRVAGVISAQPGLSLGEAGEGKVLVATTGRVKVRVDATQAPIKVGDLLVTSDRQGFAMKSEPEQVGKRQMHSPGTIIGKALESLAGGTGEILVLLSLQ
jgi:hypothetical protein